MPSIQEEILQAFFERLTESKDFDAAKVQALQTLFETDEKLKADDIVKTLIQISTETVP